MALKESLEHLSDAVTKIYEAARTDSKTPLQSLFALNEIIQYASESRDIHDVVVFADINNFKNINTKYGYGNGDSAIEKVGELMLEYFVNQLNAKAFHISGDEFVLLLNFDALQDFKDNCKYFKSCQVLITDDASIADDEETQSFTVGVSFGIAVSAEDSDFQEIKSRAEVACKKAKSIGAGKFVEWDDELEQTKLKEVRANCFNCNVSIEMSFPSVNKSKVNLACPFCQDKMKI